MTDQTLINALCLEVDKKREELFDLCFKLIEYPNVSPPGRNSTQVQDYIENYL